MIHRFTEIVEQWSSRELLSLLHTQQLRHSAIHSQHQRPQPSLETKLSLVVRAKKDELGIASKAPALHREKHGLKNNLVPGDGY